jgi:hypothetical protein
MRQMPSRRLPVTTVFISKAGVATVDDKGIDLLRRTGAPELTGK